jgi:hypothetical protein
LIAPHSWQNGYNLEHNIKCWWRSREKGTLLCC